MENNKQKVFAFRQKDQMRKLKLKELRNLLFCMKLITKARFLAPFQLARRFSNFSGRQTRRFFPRLLHSSHSPSPPLPNLKNFFFNFFAAFWPKPYELEIR